MPIAIELVEHNGGRPARKEYADDIWTEYQNKRKRWKFFKVPFELTQMIV